jgi:hypothetical protein
MVKLKALSAQSSMAHTVTGILFKKLPVIPQNSLCKIISFHYQKGNLNYICVIFQILHMSDYYFELVLAIALS